MRVRLEAVHEDVLRALNGEWPWRVSLNIPGNSPLERLPGLDGYWLCEAACSIAIHGRGEELEPREVRRACLELEFLRFVACDQQSGLWSLTDAGRRWLAERDAELVRAEKGE